MENLDQVKEGISKLLSSLNYELYSFKFKKVNRESVLEVIIDKDEDISMEDIVNVSEKISNYLDEHDFTDNAYNLDVSSLGAEKEFKIEKADKYVGRYIFVHIINAQEGTNSFEGYLKEVNDETITIEITIKTRKKLITINKTNIDLLRFAIKF